MKLSPLRWLAKNLATLLLAFILALIVWVSAVTSADPNEQHVLWRHPHRNHRTGSRPANHGQPG